MVTTIRTLLIALSFLQLAVANFNFKLPDLGRRIDIVQEEGTVSTNPEEELITFQGKVNIISKSGLEIIADQADLYNNDQRIELSGNVLIHQGPLTHAGDNAVIDDIKKTLNSKNLRSRIAKLYIQTEEIKGFEKDGETTYIGKNATITTHNSNNPHWWLKAKEIIIHSKGWVELKRVTYNVQGVPFFWFPYYAQPASGNLGYYMRPGSDSIWGTFMQNRYGAYLLSDQSFAQTEDGQPKVIQQYHFDLLSQKGIGHGLTIFDETSENKELSEWRYYGINDLAPNDSRNGIPREGLNSYRYLLQAKQRYQISLNQTLDFNINHLSDRFYLQDFDTARAFHQRELDNQFTWTRNSSAPSPDQWTITVAPHLNRFQQSITQLPEIRYDQATQRFLQYRWTGFNEIGYYQHQLADWVEDDLLNELTTATGDRATEIERLLRQNEYKRFHTHQQVSRSFDTTSWLTTTANASVGALHYWDLQDAYNPDFNQFSQIYTALDVGWNANLFYRNDDLYNDFLGLSGLIHNIQPFAKVSFLGNQASHDEHPVLDQNIINTRPFQLDAGNQAAYDDLDSWSLVRAGLSQSFITKRDQRNHPWLKWDSYIDVFQDDPLSGRSQSNWYNDFQFNPSRLTSVRWESQLPTEENGFTQSNLNLNFNPIRALSTSISHYYLKKHPILTDANFLSTRAFYRINEQLGLQTQHRFNLDNSSLIYHSYGLQKDLDSWILNLDCFQRRHLNRNEIGVTVGFQLKAFPSVAAPFTLGQ